MEILNICCSDFSRISQADLDYIDGIKISKCGYYLETAGLNRLHFPCYYFADILPSPYIFYNLCLDFEAAYVCSHLTKMERAVFINDPSFFNILKVKKFEFLKKFAEKEIILTSNPDILNMTKEILHKEVLNVYTEIKL